MVKLSKFRRYCLRKVENLKVLAGAVRGYEIAFQTSEFLRDNPEARGLVVCDQEV
jgi:hypothetical protein